MARPTFKEAYSKYRRQKVPLWFTVSLALVSVLIMYWLYLQHPCMFSMFGRSADASCPGCSKTPGTPAKSAQLGLDELLK